MEILQENLKKIIEILGNILRRVIISFLACDGTHKRVYRLTLFSNKFIGVCSTIFSNYNRIKVIIICTKFTSFIPNFGEPL